MSTDRRTLLLSGLGLGGALALRSRFSPGSVRPAEPFQISLAEWSFHRALHQGELDPRDFAPLARKEFGIDVAEHVNTFFQDKAVDFAYLADMKQRADDAGVKHGLIMCDAEGELGDADDTARRQAVENHFRWIAAARYLGCHSIRVNAAGSGAPEEVSKRAAESLHHLCTVGEQYAIDVIVENHGGYSSNGAWLAATIKAADHPRAGTLPDFGNFNLGDGKTYDRYRGIAEMMPFARGVSAKSYAFDAQGEETTIDYHRMLKIVVDAGYHGHLGIEFEGDGVSEKEGVGLTKALLERVRAELSALPR